MKHHQWLIPHRLEPLETHAQPSGLSALDLWREPSTTRYDQAGWPLTLSPVMPRGARLLPQVLRMEPVFRSLSLFCMTRKAFSFVRLPSYGKQTLLTESRAWGFFYLQGIRPR